MAEPITAGKASSIAYGTLGDTNLNTVYTAEGNTRVKLVNVLIANTETTKQQQITLKVVLSGTTVTPLSLSNVPARGNINAPFNFWLEPGDVVKLQASVASKLDYIITGEENVL